MMELTLTLHVKVTLIPSLLIKNTIPSASIFGPEKNVIKRSKNSEKVLNESKKDTHILGSALTLKLNIDLIPVYLLKCKIYLVF